MRWKIPKPEKHTLWFAWFPVRTQSGYLVWLEFVQRDLFNTGFEEIYHYELNPVKTKDL